MTAVHTTTRAGLARTTLARTTLARAVAVELHKLVDTRGQRAVIAGGLLGMAAFAGGRALWPTTGTDMWQLATMACGPAGWMLLVLAVLLASGEFTRGTIEPSLLQDPRRGRLVTAKLLAVLVAALVLLLVAVVMGVGAAVIGPWITGDAIPLRGDVGRLALAAGHLAFTGVAALGWALLTRSAPAPIMVLLLWPTIALLLASASAVAERLLSWVSLDAVWALADPSPGSWARLGTSMLAWAVLPLVAGLVRLVRGDL
ncbi:hypothetical protein ACTQ49_11320 [Luteococcus sp. Sow4_B9]|uniref:hypothetical protein n=1 Tax=unclassified Luteococcus TaxID=2639923 RepID=UPI003735E109